MSDRAIVLVAMWGALAIMGWRLPIMIETAIICGALATCGVMG